MLNDVTQIDTSVSILGMRCDAPIMVAPFGRHKLFHPEGERATARGAAAAGAVFVLPTTSTVSIEEVASEPGSAPRWFQLYLPPERALAENLIDRAAAAGFRADRAHGRPAGLRLEPARGARAAGGVAGHSQRQSAGPAHCAAFLQGGPHRHGDVSGDLARPRMAGAAFARGRAW